MRLLFPRMTCSWSVFQHRSLVNVRSQMSGLWEPNVSPLLALPFNNRSRLFLCFRASTPAHFSPGMIKVSCRLLPVVFLSLVDQPPGLSVHDRRPGSGLLPAIVVLHQAGDQLVWKLRTNTTKQCIGICKPNLNSVWVCLSAILVSHHLLDAVKALAVEAEGLFEQHFVLHSPLIREGGEVGQVGEWALHVVFVP